MSGAAPRSGSTRTSWHSIPARFVFRNFPRNQSPVEDNWVYLSLNCSATAGATSDFSSTFESAA